MLVSGQRGNGRLDAEMSRFALEQVIDRLQSAHDQIGRARRHVLASRVSEPWVAQWLLSGRYLALARAHLHMLASGFGSESHVMLRSLEEAGELFEAVQLDEVALQWLDDKNIWPGAARGAFVDHLTKIRRRHIEETAKNDERLLARLDEGEYRVLSPEEKDILRAEFELWIKESHSEDVADVEEFEALMERFAESKSFSDWTYKGLSAAAHHRLEVVWEAMDVKAGTLRSGSRDTGDDTTSALWLAWFFVQKRLVGIATWLAQRPEASSLSTEDANQQIARLEEYFPPEDQLPLPPWWRQYTPARD